MLTDRLLWRYVSQLSKYADEPVLFFHYLASRSWTAGPSMLVPLQSGRDWPFFIVQLHKLFITLSDSSPNITTEKRMILSKVFGDFCLSGPLQARAHLCLLSTLLYTTRKRVLRAKSQMYSLHQTRKRLFAIQEEKTKLLKNKWSCDLKPLSVAACCRSVASIVSAVVRAWNLPTAIDVLENFTANFVPDSDICTWVDVILNH